MAKDNILSHAPAEGAHDARLQLGATDQHLLLVGREPSESLGLAAGDQRHFLDGIVLSHQGAHQGMANLVIGNQALAAAIGERFALHASDDPINSVIDFSEGDRLFAAPGCEDRCLIEQVGEIGASKPGRATGNGFQGHLWRQLFVAAVDIENGKPPLDIGSVNRNLPIKAARAHQGRVEHIGTVGCRDDNDAAISLEPIHFGEQLVEGLLPLIISSTNAGTTLTANGIDFIDKDQAGTVFLGTFKQIPHATGTNTNEHLNKF